MSTYQEPNFPAIFSEGQGAIRPFDKKLITVLSQWSQNLKFILDRGISWADNMDAVDVTFTSSATPDVENTVAHTLGKVPTGVIVYSQDKAGSVYNGTTAFSKTNVYLKCNVASMTVKAKVF